MASARVGAIEPQSTTTKGPFLRALASLKVVGYSSYVLPFVLGVIGWHYFWCRDVDAGYTKLVGAALFVVYLAGLMALARGAFAPADGDGAAWGGWIGSTAAAVLRAFFNRTGAAICLLTLLVLAVIMSTQFSFGRAASSLGKRLRATPGLLDRWSSWREERQRAHPRLRLRELEAPLAHGRVDLRRRHRRPAITGERANGDAQRQGQPLEAQVEIERVVVSGVVGRLEDDERAAARAHVQVLAAGGAPVDEGR